MFTGIVEELGTVVAVEPLADSARLRIRGPLVTSDAVHGASIAVNGVCLTVVEHADGEFTASKFIPISNPMLKLSEASFSPNNMPISTCACAGLGVAVAMSATRTVPAIVRPRAFRRIALG